MTAAVETISRPGDFWISDNPFAVAAANRDIPGPLVDTSGQRTRAGLLTVADLEAARVRYDVRWVLVDSFRPWAAAPSSTGADGVRSGGGLVCAARSRSSAGPGR
jgi:hypothetical protein